MSRFSSSLLSMSFAILLASAVSGCGYNRIPTDEEAAKAQWAEVQNQYQRRADLVPNLVATVQGYAKQEKDVLISVTEARRRAEPEQLQTLSAFHESHDCLL